MSVYSLLSLLCCEPPLPILPGATLPLWPVSRDSPRHQRLASRPSNPTSVYKCHVLQPTVCLCVCFPASGGVHKRKREREWESETENNKIEEKNTACNCVGERRLLYIVIHSTQHRLTGATLSAISHNLMKGSSNVCAPCSLYILRPQLWGWMRQLINHTRQSSAAKTAP